LNQQVETQSRSPKVSPLAEVTLMLLRHSKHF
jgi:hypothetical protein